VYIIVPSCFETLSGDKQPTSIVDKNLEFFPISLKKIAVSVELWDRWLSRELRIKEPKRHFEIFFWGRLKTNKCSQIMVGIIMGDRMDKDNFLNVITINVVARVQSFLRRLKIR